MQLVVSGDDLTFLGGRNGVDTEILVFDRKGPRIWREDLCKLYLEPSVQRARGFSYCFN